MATVAFVVHHRRPHAAGYARRAAAWLHERGHRVVMPKHDAEALGMEELGIDELAIDELAIDELAIDELAIDELGIDEHLLASGDVELDLTVALGGDGTMLRAVRWVAPRGIPVMGVNLGRLSYLADIEPDNLVAALESFLAGQCAVEERMMLAVDVERVGRPGSHRVLALNEAAFEKPRPGNTVHLAVEVDGRPWTTYASDGLIVATPTGSTAYSFSARGPILSPWLRALLLTPVSPHMPFDRSLVLSDREPVRVIVSDERPALFTVDGRDQGILDQGDSVVCTAAPTPARFVTFGPRDFYGILKGKFGVADR